MRNGGDQYENKKEVMFFKTAQELSFDSLMVYSETEIYQEHLDVKKIRRLFIVGYVVQQFMLILSQQIIDLYKSFDYMFSQRNGEMGHLEKENRATIPSSSMIQIVFQTGNAQQIMNGHVCTLDIFGIPVLKKEVLLAPLETPIVCIQILLQHYAVLHDAHKSSICFVIGVAAGKQLAHLNLAYPNLHGTDQGTPFVIIRGKEKQLAIGRKQHTANILEFRYLCVFKRCIIWIIDLPRWAESDHFCDDIYFMLGVNLQIGRTFFSHIFVCLYQLCDNFLIVLKYLLPELILHPVV
ncbi:hypothetical protein ACJX0J_039189, partial [Zea mays]